HSRSPGPTNGSSRDAAADLLRREELRRLRVLDRRVLATPRPYRGPDGERRQRTAVTSAGAGWPGPSGAPAELDHVLGEALVAAVHEVVRHVLGEPARLRGAADGLGGEPVLREHGEPL